MLPAFFLVHQAHACDVCGGTVSTPTGAAVPGIFSNFIGWNGSFRSFSSTHLTLFEHEIPVESEEQFMTMALQGRYSPVRRLQLLAHLPYSTVVKEMEGERRSASGFSDAVIRANYLMVDRSKDSTGTVLNLFLGSSVKLPTGRHAFRSSENYFFHQNMLPGTGAFDVGMHLDGFFRQNKYGITLNVAAIFRGAIRDQYDYGNAYQARVSAFRFFEFRQSSLMLDLGMELAVNGRDRDLTLQNLDDYTGGWMLSPSLRVNYNRKRVVLSVTAQRPVAQYLAENHVTNNIALQGSIIYLFKQRKQ
jgi:hypothetical protein